MTEPRIEDAEDPKVTFDEDFDRVEDPHDRFVREMSALITKALANIVELKKQIDEIAKTSKV